MRLKMKNTSCRYDKNRPRSGHGHKYIKYKISLSIMMVICIKQHISNILSSINEKLSNTDPGLKKSVAYIKKRVSSKSILS